MAYRIVSVMEVTDDGELAETSVYKVDEEKNREEWDLLAAFHNPSSPTCVVTNDSLAEPTPPTGYAVGPED